MFTLTTMGQSFFMFLPVLALAWLFFVFSFFVVVARTIYACRILPLSSHAAIFTFDHQQSIKA